MEHRFDEFPFIEDRLVCGINAFIELLNLPIKKLSKVSRTGIGEKLLELSNFDSILYTTLTSQSVKFNSIIEQIFFEEEEQIERLYQLTEEKFRHYLRTGEYI